MGIELPDGKISRTLPEQVGENTRRLSTLEQYQIQSFYIEDGILYAKRVSGEIFSLGEITGVSNVQLTNGHLIFTLTDGSTIDAGLIKGISNVSINSSQHLIVQYDNGTSQDLGAIFSGDVNVDGNFTANSIIENMSGYGYLPITKENATITYTYVGAVKNGNKLTFACSGYFSRSGDLLGWNCNLIAFTFPNTIGVKLYQTEIGGVSGLAFAKLDLCKAYASHIDIPIRVYKDSNSQIGITMYQLNSTEVNTPYLFRFEITFLLSDNMVQ